eukprot:TRINITY_DN11595_c0_g2_i1.p1 TRINITY_DN11595_c0_g2~~TRINITY_DN11595_c0_g2_i1.p1  ORF type:complete len:130 (-),score=10.87 TRINITY_DN11595_c0_g2_i1:339-728(-)
MISGVEQAWARGQKLQHARVNTLLAMVAAISLPLTFLTALYGTNFGIVPVTKLGDGFWGYMAFWGISVVFLGVMIRTFGKQDWFTLLGWDRAARGRFLVAWLCIAAAFPVVDLVLYFTTRLGHADNATS